MRAIFVEKGSTENRVKSSKGRTYGTELRYRVNLMASGFVDSSMTIKKLLKEIRELVDVFPEKKTDKERLRLLFKIKLLVETIEGRIKERSDKKRVVYEAKTRIIKRALKQLLTIRILATCCMR